MRHRSSGTTAVAELAELVGYQLHFTNLIAMRGARAALAERQVTPAKVTAMLFIRYNPGCDQATLGRLLSVNRSSAMKLVNHLVARGLVARQPGRDLRSNGLQLTAAGRSFLDEMLVILKSAEAGLCAGLDAHERTELLRLLVKVQQGAISDNVGGGAALDCGTPARPAKRQPAASKLRQPDCAAAALDAPDDARGAA